MSFINRKLAELDEARRRGRLERDLAQLGLAEAERIFTHTTTAERMQLYELAKTCGPHALEVGSYLGSSACFIAAGLKPQGGKLYCVDTWNNETMPEGDLNTFETFTRNVRNFSGQIVPLRKRSTELRAQDVSPPLDLVFLDGDHSEEAVGAELDMIGPWVRPGGVIAFHDSIWFPGVTKTIGRALQSGDWAPIGQVDNLLWIQRRQ